jgi:hypothetical protein
VQRDLSDQSNLNAQRKGLGEMNASLSQKLAAFRYTQLSQWNAILPAGPTQRTPNSLQQLQALLTVYKDPSFHRIVAALLDGAQALVSVTRSLRQELLTAL